MAIRENIIKLRSLFGLTQEQLANIAGVSRGAVSQWEGGFSEPRMGAIQNIADNLGIMKSNIIEDGGMDFVQVDPITRRVTATNNTVIPGNAIRVVPSEDVMVPVKVVGTVHAGDPDEGFAATDIAPLPKTIWERHKSSFALQARGWCMDNVFSDQSIVFVDPAMQPQDNSICVFLLDGTETVVRRLKVGSTFDMLTPDSHDKSIEDIIVKKDGTRECVCQGVVFFYQAPREME